MALCLQGALLLRAGHEAIAAAFCTSRLQGDGGLAYGTLSAGAPVDVLIERAWSDAA